MDEMERHAAQEGLSRGPVGGREAFRGSVDACDDSIVHDGFSRQRPTRGRACVCAGVGAARWFLQAEVVSSTAYPRCWVTETT
ncbi:hypothetical protein, partial [Streptomyces sp. ADI91-18]|uniref:hypothetical protein n=1 Tax=Streptomyces sp. ADI91-18 TaxID=1522755 RepID=UPI0019D230D3